MLIHLYNGKNDCEFADQYKKVTDLVNFIFHNSLDEMLILIIIVDVQHRFIARRIIDLIIQKVD